MTTMKLPDFEAPGPGVWTIEDHHMTRPVCRYIEHCGWLDAQREGHRATFGRYGALLDTIELRTVNRFAYGQTAPYGAPAGAPPPPRFVFKLLTRLHPALRARLKVAQRAVDTKQWRSDLERWRTSDKPRIASLTSELRSVDVAALSDEELVAHIDACRRAFNDAHRVHLGLNMAIAVPIGDLMLLCMEHANATPTEVLEVLRGSSPISAGEAEGRDDLVSALKKSADARAVLKNGKAADDKLSTLRGMNSGVGPSLERWLGTIGIRPLTGAEIGERTVGESPEAVVRALTQLVDDTASRRRALAADESAAALRSRLPAAQRGAFDDLLEDARPAYGLRDERNLECDAPLIGLTRLRLLAAGDRLKERGALHHHEHAVELTPDELAALLVGEDGPSADEVADHASYRERFTTADAPAVLGGEVTGPPDFTALPHNGRSLHLAVGVFLDNMWGDNHANQVKPEGKKLAGLAASGGTYEGRARIVNDPSAFERIEDGDVLIARFTAPAYNVLLPLLGGIVTDRGGPLCHAAIVAREYGIPGVVATREATQLIPDGARVRVDGDTGVVEVLS